MEDFEREIKCIVVGNGGVGKTSMIRRFCNNIFTEGYKKTIGVDFLEKQFYVPSLGQDVQLYLWDTAGQEEFDSITKTYYRGAGAAVLAFSTTDRASFEALPSWKAKVVEQCNDIAMVLVQNKVDLLDKAAVSSEEAEAMARRLGLKFYRTCVKEDLNVTEVFSYLAELHDRKLSSGALQATAALPLLEAGAPSTTSAPGAAAASGQSSGGYSSGSPGSSALPSGAGAGVTATVSPVSNSQQGPKSGGSGSGGVNGLPAVVELQPSVKRGRKKLSTKIKHKAAKFAQCRMQ